MRLIASYNIQLLQAVKCLKVLCPQCDAQHSTKDYHVFIMHISYILGLKPVFFRWLQVNVERSVWCSATQRKPPRTDLCTHTFISNMSSSAFEASAQIIYHSPCRFYNMRYLQDSWWIKSYSLQQKDTGKSFFFFFKSLSERKWGFSSSRQLYLFT